MRSSKAINLWDQDKFYKFLISRKQISHRVAKNYISRCKRIENLFGVNLLNETSSIEGYVNLCEKILRYSEKNCKTTKEVSTLSGNLRMSARAFALYAHGIKSFPREYRYLKLSCV